MHKYIATAVALAFLLFALGLLAQTTGASGQTSNPASGTTSSQNPNSPAGDQVRGQSSTSGSAAQQENYPSGSQSSAGYGTSQSSSSSTMSSQGKKRTVEGCVVRQETDYFLIPKNGAPLRLNAGSTGDLSQHVGHRVKVHGNETPATSAGMGASGSAGTTGAAASSSTNTMGSATGSTGAVSENPNRTTNPQPGEPSTESNTQAQSSGSTAPSGSNAGASVGSNMGSYSTGSDMGPSAAGKKAGTSGQTSGNLSSAATQEIVVDKLTMVSETCPANWNPNYTSGGTGSNY